jgi:hypothetical protein
LWNFTGGGQGFNEHGLLIGHSIGDEIEIFKGKREIIRKSSVSPHDS